MCVFILPYLCSFWPSPLYVSSLSLCQQSNLLSFPTFSHIHMYLMVITTSDSPGISLIPNTCIAFLLSLFCSDSYFALPTWSYTIPKRCLYIWLSYLACSFLSPSSSPLATPFLIPLSSSMGPHCLSNKLLGFTLAFKAFYKSG